MNIRKTLQFATGFLALAGLTFAADLAGHWTSEFDSPIGPQKYTYDFQSAGDKTTGKATYDHSMGKGEAPLSDIKVNGDEVSFSETVEIQGAPLVITYTGKISGDEMKLTRNVGDFGSEQVVAKRAKK